MRERALQYGAVMRLPLSKAPKEFRIDRKKISEAVLADRLGLNEEWIDYEDQKGGLEWESFAPDDLPQFIRCKLESAEIKDVERNVKRLVEAGCCEPVIYFCLEELSPEADQRRSRGEVVAVSPKRKPSAGRDSPSARARRPRAPGEESQAADSPKAGSSDEEEIPAATVRRRLAPAEELEAVTNAARKAKDVIHRYQRELLLVADAADRTKLDRLKAEAHDRLKLNPRAAEVADRAELDWPRRTVTVPEYTEDALELLNESLAWVSSLAEAYTAPFETTLLKSKGLLYLTAYRDCMVDAKKIQGRARARLDKAVADLANLVVGEPDKQWSPTDLREKLQEFRQDHERLYWLLRRKLADLHRHHTKRSPSPPQNTAI